MNHGLRVALIASARHPIREPFAGGLEAHTWSLADQLRRRGHQVTVFAGDHSDVHLGVRDVTSRWPELSAAARSDVSMPPLAFMEEHHAYLRAVLDLVARGRSDFDIVHNNSLHHLPVAMAAAIPVPVVTTLHTPPTPWLESAIQAGPCPVTFVAVSRHTAGAWRHVVPVSRVIPNGVDLEKWHFGCGGGSLIWSGRLAAEKGADLAILAARRAGLRLDLVGPISDPRFFAERVEPLLGGSVRYLGHLTQGALVEVVGRGSVSLVTPRWDEPYGLVAAESLACGTPVAGFARGALPDLLDDESGVLVPADDVDALAAAAVSAWSLRRRAARARAEKSCSLTHMVDSYEALYRELSLELVA